MKKLFLDDIRMPYEVGNYINPVNLRQIFRKEEWDIVRNYKEFVNWIDENGVPNTISFDHDLALIHYDPKACKEKFEYYEETGYDCAKYLLEFCLENDIEFPDYMVHSMNPVGKENIINLLKRYKVPLT